MMSTREKLKYAIGSVAETVLPWISADIDKNVNTEKFAKLKKCMVFARSHRAKAKGDLGQLEKALSSYWESNTGDEFHSRHIEIRYTLFLELHAYIIDELVEIASKTEPPFSRLVEIGCGDGQALAYCSTKLPDLSMFGLDINASAIERAKRDHGDTGNKREFVTTDALPWLEKHPQGGTVLMTNGGVLEYFNQTSVSRLFELVGQNLPGAVIVIEPLAPDHDLTRDHGSIVFGRENTFSHDYPDLLKKAGFTICSQRDFTHSSARWLVVLASKH